MTSFQEPVGNVTLNTPPKTNKALPQNASSSSFVREQYETNTLAINTKKHPLFSDKQLVTRRIPTEPRGESPGIDGLQRESVTDGMTPWGTLYLKPAARAAAVCNYGYAKLGPTPYTSTAADSRVMVINKPL